MWWIARRGLHGLRGKDVIGQCVSFLFGYAGA